MSDPIYTCERCGHERGISDVILAAVDDAAFQHALLAAASLPPTHADAALRYMRLFGAIRHPAYAKLLGDLAEAISTGQFIHQRKAYKASSALWLAALTDTLTSTTIRLPLKAANGHGFLFAIAAAKADQAAAKAEQRREEQLRHPAAELRQADTIIPAPTLADIRRRELEADVRHWDAQARFNPDDARIAGILSTARAKLSAEFPDCSNGV